MRNSKSAYRISPNKRPGVIVFVVQIYPEFFSIFQKITFRCVLMVLSDSRDTVVARINLITPELSTNVSYECHFY